ncbi:MAG: hypothetical protein IJY94_02365 [Clostridia bacterium]|nr:hypothetical protein [Clostridia bacterium]
MNNERMRSARELTKENRHIIMKIEQYLEARYINEVAGEEILSDIVGMALECQERGESFADVIGTNPEAFCRELIKNSPRQHFHERILSVLHWFLLFAMLLLPGLYLIEILFPTYSPGFVKNFEYTVRFSYILKYYIIMFVLVIGWYFVRMNSYKPSRYVFGTYFAVFMLFFLFTDGLLKFVIRDHVITVNVLIWLITFAVLLIMCDLARRVIAMTIAYAKNKTKN